MALVAASASLNAAAAAATASLESITEPSSPRYFAGSRESPNAANTWSTRAWSGVMRPSARSLSIRSALVAPGTMSTAWADAAQLLFSLFSATTFRSSAHAIT